MTRIRVQEADFNLQEEYERLRRHSGQGAIVTFSGLVRDFDGAGDGEVDWLYLQHYPGMTERLLEETVAEAQSRWELGDVTVIHRVGTLYPGEQIVLVAVSAPHRQGAFEAACFLMDYLKTRATFWKKTGAGGRGRWLDMKDSDRRAAERWRGGASAP